MNQEKSLFSQFSHSPRRILAIGVILLALFSLVGAFTDTTLSGNDATRFAVIQAVGEQRVFHIENTEFRTVDMVHRDGHIYSDKPLFLGWSLGLLHRAVSALTNWSFTENYSFLIWFYNALFGFTCNALIFWWLFNTFRRIRKGSLPVKGLLALAGVCSTWILSYNVLLNNHTPAALAVLGVYIMLIKYRQIPSAALAWGIGAGAGLTAALDIPTGGLLCAAVIWAVAQMNGRKQAVQTAAAAAAVVFLNGLLNFAAYGTWVPLYLAGNTGTFQPEMVLSAGYIAETLIGWRGFFLYQPFLVFGLIPCKQESVPDRCMYMVSIAAILFYCTNTVEFGGAAYGFRYLIPIIPVLYYRAGKMLLAYPKYPVRKKVLAATLLLWGMASATAGAYAPFCVAFEGYRSPEGHFTRTVRSSFAGNLLCAGFEYAPDSLLTETLIRHYGKACAYRFLYESYFNIKRPDLIRKVQEKMMAERPEREI